MPRLPLPVQSNYQSTRFDLRTVNLRPNAQGGVRQFPGITLNTQAQAFSLTKALDISGQCSAPHGIKWNNDGSRFFVSDNLNFQTHEYAASTNYRLTGATFTDASSSMGVGYAIVGFNADGTKYFHLKTNGDLLREESLSTGFDVSTESGSPTTYDLSANLTDSRGGCFNNNGTKLFVIDGGDTIHEYAMSSAYDPSTLSHTTSVDFSDVSSNITGISFNSDGSEFVIADRTNNHLSRYSTISAFSLTGVTSSNLLGSLDISGDDLAMLNIDWDDSDNTVYMVGNQNDSAYEYALNSSDRGAMVMAGLPYIVAGGSLYSIDSSGVTSNLGATSGAQRCILDTDGTHLVIANGSNPYEYTTASGLVEITDADLPDTNTVAYLDNRFYFEAAGGKIYGSALGDPSSIAATDFITAESFTDGITRLISDNRFLYALGTRTGEIYRVTGEGNIGLSRQKVHDDLGIVGRYAAGKTDNGIYIIDHRRRLVLLSGLSFRPIFNPGFANKLEGYSTVSDCIINTYEIEGEEYIEMNFPTQDVCWTYHERTGQFIEREDSSNNRFRATSYMDEAFNKLLGIDHANGKVYEFSETTYQDDGSNITRIKDIYLSAEVFGKPTGPITLNRLNLRADSSGSGSMDVQIAADLSSFSTAKSKTVNGPGIYNFDQFGQFDEAILRLKTTANVRMDWLNSSVEVEFDLP